MSTRFDVEVILSRKVVITVEAEDDKSAQKAAEQDAILIYPGFQYAMADKVTEHTGEPS